MSWDSAEQAVSRPKGAGKFLRFEDGDAVQLVFVGEPQEYLTTWDDGKKSTRVGCNVYNVESGVVQIHEMSGTTFQKVIEARNLYAQAHGGIHNVVFMMRRTGVSLQTVYSLLFVRAITADEARNIEQAELYDILDSCYDQSPQAPSAPQPVAGQGSYNGVPVTGKVPF